MEKTVKWTCYGLRLTSWSLSEIFRLASSVVMTEHCLKYTNKNHASCKLQISMTFYNKENNIRKRNVIQLKNKLYKIYKLLDALSCFHVNY